MKAILQTRLLAATRRGRHIAGAAQRVFDFLDEKVETGAASGLFKLLAPNINYCSDITLARKLFNVLAGKMINWKICTTEAMTEAKFGRLLESGHSASDPNTP